MADPYPPPLSPGAPPLMPLPPRMPRGRLWLSLLAPPFSVGLAMVLLGFLDQAKVLATQGWIPGALIVVCLGIMIVSLVAFIGLVARRYRGGSLALLILGYLLGQGVVCFAVFFGCCLLVIGGMKF